MAGKTSQGTEQVVYVDRATAPHDWGPFVEGDQYGRFNGFVTDDGWVYWRQMAKPEIRLKIDTSGPRIAIVAVVVLPRPDTLESPPTVRASDLRDVPLGQLEDHLNAPKMVAFIRRTLDAAGTSEGRPFGQSDSDGATVSYKLDGVGKHNRPDTFYEQLAAAWAHARGAGHNDPAVRIANANGVTPAAVHRWAREARARGLMAPSGRRNAHNARRAPQDPSR